MIDPVHPYRIPTRLAVVLLLFLLGGFLAPPAHGEPAGIELSLEEINPEFLTEDDELNFVGRISNSGEELSEVTIWWRMYTSVLTAETYSAWLAGDADLEPVTFSRHDLPDGIRPGREQSFDIVVPPESSPFDYGSATGPRGMELVVTATTSDGTRVSDSVRSTIIWLSPQQPDATPMTVAVPLTPTAQEWTTALTEGSPVVARAGERSLAVLQALAEHEVTWGLDAALLDSTPLGRLAELLPQEASDDVPEPSPEALTWPDSTEVTGIRAVLGEQHKDSSVVSLGWAAPDHHLLARGQAAGQKVRDLNTSYSEALLESVGVTPQANTVWSLVPLTVGEASRLDDATMVMVPATRTGSHVVPPTAQSVMIHSASQAFSDLLASELEPRELRTLSLIHALSDPHLIAALPVDVDRATAERVAANLDALSDLPWLRSAPLDRVDTVTPTEAPASGVANLRNNIDLNALTADLARLDALNSVVEHPEQYRAVIITPALLATSSVWEESAPEPEQLTELLDAGARAEFLTIEHPSTVNLISQGGDLPVGVQNNSPISITPRVVVEPEDARLLVEEQVEIHLAPRDSTTVMVPITAVANGNVETTIRLFNAEGLEIAPPETFTVRVRAEWETTGTAITAGLIAVAFLLGLIRNVRRRPRRHTGGS